MERLKNCPNCGGILDDSGRCIYCKSKIYDLTDINLDFNKKDILLMKIKQGEQTVIMKVYPTNISVEYKPIIDTYCSFDGKYHSIMEGQHTTIHLDLQSI